MKQSALDFLKKRLENTPQYGYANTSRIHPLKSLQTSSGPCFIKREDELGFGISGFKIRKYRTLIPELIQSKTQEAILIGGAFSNNILSLSQLLIEKGITPHLWLKGPKPTQNRGNFLLSQLLLQTPICWIQAQQWPQVNTLANAYAKIKEHTYVIPEGASLFSAFIGSLTLALDIIRNENEHQLHFDHLFIEAGTGYSAAALLLAFSFIQKRTHLHILQVAGREEDFLQTLQTLHLSFEKWLEASCPFPTFFSLLRPSTASSFGSTNQSTFQTIAEVAKTEGFFLDPIYSAKLFFEVKKNLKQTPLNGLCLIIHSGGALSLSGFQDKLEKFIYSD